MCGQTKTAANTPAVTSKAPAVSPKGTASATVNTKQVLKEVPDGVTLVLSQAAAEHLMALTGYIGGLPEGPRGSFNQIRRSLSRIGIKDAENVTISGTLNIN